MADYKRMVSYMYQYEDGIKKKNVGFVRVEVRGGQCKLTLHMQLLGQLDSVFPTYLIRREQKGVELIYLGDTLLKNQVMDSKLSAEETNIMGTGLRLSDMGGLLLFLNDSIFFATEWDDKPILANEVMEALNPKSRNPNEKENPMQIFQTTDSDAYQEAQRPLEEELRIPRYKLPGGFKMIERLQDSGKVKLVEELDRMTLSDEQQDRVNNAANQYNLEFSQEENDETAANPDMLDNFDVETIQAICGDDADQEVNLSDIEYQPFGYQNRKDQTAAKAEQGYEDMTEINSNSKSLNEQAYEKIEGETLSGEGSHLQVEQGMDTVSLEEKAQVLMNELNQPDHPTAQKFFQNYPRIYPFEDNEIIISVKIEPKDIGSLPKELWQLSNNSFLLHGYYCYHHLVFAKVKNRMGCRYILGIPGIFHNREQFMARMFGFESFKSIRKRELKQGDFGYWYIPVIL